MDDKNIIARPITRVTSGSRVTAEDFLIREETWHILLDGQSVAELNCLPSDLEQLAAGHLLTRGLLRQAAEIEKMTLDGEAKKITVKLKSCAYAEKPPDEDGLTLSAADIHRLQSEFNDRCELYRQTGATHSVALADKDGLLICLEDVARHNALDKVIGEMVLRGISPANKALIFSGRLASDMLRKVRAIGVKLLIAPGAPTSAGVEIAEEHGITLLGFVRKNNINIYTHENRVSD
jgi:FdhD protein